MTKNNNSLIQFKKDCLTNELFFSENYVKYLSVHKGKDYKISEFLSNEFNSPVFLMYTNVSNEISYFGFPIEFYSKYDKTLSSKLKIVNQFLIKKNLLSHEKIFSLGVSELEITNAISEKINPKLITEHQFIDLDDSEEKIFKNLKSNLRYEINKTKKNKDIQVKIINKENYSKNLIFEMMETHSIVSGRQTRSKDTWLINEQMILQNQGFISVVYYKSKAVSYSFFFHNSRMIYYFSSATLREYFKYSGISHLSLWEAILYAKKIYIKKFNLGLTNYLYTRNDVNISSKEKNIAFFKSRYCGKKKYKIILDRNSFFSTN